MEEGSPASRPEEYVASPFGPTSIGRHDAVALDREDLKLLASDTRLDILKALKTRRMTVSELASTLALGKSTVFEHLNKLVEGGLVIRHDDPNREWVYYELAPKSRRLFNPVSAKIVLMFSTVVAVALAALVGWSLVSTAGPGLHVEAGPGEVLAGEPVLFEVSATTTGGDPVADASLHLLTAEQYAAFRDGEPPATTGLSGVADASGRKSLLVALEPGDYHFAASLPALGLASGDGSGRVVVSGATLHVDPSPLVLGADDERVVRIWLTHGDRVLDSGTLLLEEDDRVSASGGRVIEVREPIVARTLTLVAPGETSLSFRPDGEGGFFAPVSGAIATAMPSFSVAPEFLVEDQSASLTVTVWHDGRGALAEAPVRVLYGARDVAAETDARGVARVPVLPREAGYARVMLGHLEIAQIPIVRQMVVQTAATPGGLDVWAQDLKTRRAVAGASVEVAGVPLATTDAEGHAVVSEKGPVVIRGPGYAPYGISVPGYEATAVHWVSSGSEASGGGEDGSSIVGSVTEVAVTAEKASVPPGGVFHVTATLHNPARKPVVESAVLTVDGSRWSVQDVPLAPGETRAVVFPVVLREPGLHRVSVNEATALEVLVESPPTPAAEDVAAPRNAPGPFAAAVAAVALAAVALRRRT